jgi:hypothetical protein
MLKLVVPVTAVIVCSLLAGCRSPHSNVPSDKGPDASVRVSLNGYGVPKDFFQPGADKCGDRIIHYRFIAWLDDQDVAVGYNLSPNCRLSPDDEVSGMLGLLVFDVSGTLKAKRNLPYLADGNGEIVADGEGMSGPKATLLIRLQSVNLDKEGTHESKSGVRLLDANLKDVAQLDGFMEQTTIVDHAVVVQEGFTLSGPRTYSIWDGPAANKTVSRQIDWPAGAMDRKFGEKSFAFMSCDQELRPDEYTSTNVVHVGAKFRCSLNVQGEDGEPWTSPLEDGRTASVVGLLADGSVVGQIHAKESRAEQLVMWKKGRPTEVLPWLPAQFEGTVDSATRDFSRYASFAMQDRQPCNAITRIFGQGCDAEGDGRWFVFDSTSPTPLVNRSFPKNGRAALSPDGTHYASFEANELRIYSLAAAN